MLYESVTFLTVSISFVNDINAYTNEIETVKNVTDSYSIEREYGLWLHQQKYKIAIEEYK